MKRIIIKVGLLSVLTILSTLNCTAQKFCQHLKALKQASEHQATDARMENFDILNYAIDAFFLDYKADQDIDARASLRIIKIQDVDTLTLDLLSLTVHSVINKANGDSLGKQYSSPKLDVDVSSIAAGDTFEIEVNYSGKPKRDAQWGGFYFAGDYAFNLGVGFASDPHNFGRAWFPCFDNFLDRAYYQFNITVDTPAVALCNGELQNVIDRPNGQRTYSWDMSEPIPTYLVAVAIAPYELIEFTADGEPVTLAAVASDTANMMKSFIHLEQCVKAFQSAYGPHTFDRIGFNMVPFNGGAMEHATNIAYPRFGIANGSLNYETLYAHELAHHWWGNTITCRNQEDMWLNEGWASFSERVFLEAVYGRDRYMEDIRDNHSKVVHYAHIRDGQALPVSGIGHANTYGMHVYDKGADMVHTLRGMMGDSAFFAACESFQSTFKFKDVSTEDMRDHFQTFTTIGLQTFFGQWIKKPGSPQFYILEDQHNATHYRFRIKQNQRLTDEVYTEVPYFISAFSADLQQQEFRIKIDGEDNVISIEKSELSFTPIYWALDFNERISDATTDEWAVIDSLGSVDFNYARFKGEVKASSDSSLLRVEHHWVSPDQYFNKIEGVAMSKERYWNIDGVWADGLEIEGTFEYNGLAPTSNPGAGFLDNKLIRITEDSLVLLYRPNAYTDWQIHPNYSRDMGSPFNKRGTVTVSNIQKGQYTFGMYDQNLLSGVKAPSQLSFKVYPNPAEKQIELSFADRYDSCLIELTDNQGKLILQHRLQHFQEKISLDLPELSSGIYYVGVTTGEFAYEPVRVYVK